MVPRLLTLLRMYELQPPATMGSYRRAIPSIISFHPTHYVAGSRPFTVPIEPKRSERKTNRRRNILLSLRIESRPRPGSPSNHTSKVPCERHVPPRSRQETSRVTWDIPLISSANAYRDPSSRRLIPLPHHNVDHPRILPNETRHLSEPMHSTNLSIRIPSVRLPLPGHTKDSALAWTGPSSWQPHQILSECFETILSDHFRPAVRCPGTCLSDS
ncbi:hypothetical protein CNYM01_08648 [Colletotrichum nymphaeae SA-01]|uniref:Uncharacterized protein n=1 Tax=Colletotrichum nymphaeae SA-01 TaxID=1460502 RepID=A0A135S1G1_9PEZI|nr:hypothetical protein CNYM01_08648 [Colletotrichum nymphaeae SA-01]